MNVVCRHIGDDITGRWRYPGKPNNLPAWQLDLKQEVFVEQHPLISTARRGDLIRVMIFVEDRHGLQVRDCQMTILHKNPLQTEEPLSTEQPGQIKRRLVRFWGRLSSII